MEGDAEVYQGFFDTSLAEVFSRLIQGTRLSEAGFDLMRNWEAASQARALPWVFTKSIDAVLTDRIESMEPFDVRKIRSILNKLVSGLEKEGEKIRPTFRKRLFKVITAIDAETTKSMHNSKKKVLVKYGPSWNSLINISQFHDSIWASERMCYGAIYFSYEWFLGECLRIKTDSPEKQLHREDEVKKCLAMEFGETIKNRCWTDSRIVIARRARHALVHNGGRVTEQLDKMEHQFQVEDGELQISASDTTQLYKLLEERVRELVETASKLPEFKL